MADRVCETFGRTYEESPMKLRGQKNYNVWMDTAPNTLWDVLQVAGLPIQGDSWDDSVLTYLVVTKRTPVEINKETLLFQVRVEYETDETQLDWQISIRSIRTSYVPTETLAPWVEHPTTWDHPRYISPSGDGGNDSLIAYPTLNRAGDYFEDQPETTRHNRQIILTRVVASISDIGDSTITNIDSLMDFLGCVNGETIQIAGISGLTWHFLVDDITVERILSSSGEYVYKVQITIMYDPVQGWATPVANIGYRSIKDVAGDLRPQQGRNFDGTSSNKPLVLDTDGSVVNIRETGLSGASGPPYYIVFPWHASRFFEFLELPEDLEP